MQTRILFFALINVLSVDAVPVSSSCMALPQFLIDHPEIPRGNNYCSDKSNSVGGGGGGGNNATPGTGTINTAETPAPQTSSQTSPIPQGGTGGGSGGSGTLLTLPNQGTDSTPGLSITNNTGASIAASGGSCNGGNVPQISGGGCKPGFRNTVFNEGAKTNAGWPSPSWQTLQQHGVSNFSQYSSVLKAVKGFGLSYANAPQSHSH